MRIFPFKIGFFLLLCCVIHGQNYICYSNCKQGFCDRSDPSICTSCDPGQVNIDGKCVSGSVQPYPLTHLTYNPQTNQLNNGSQSLISCQLSNTSFFSGQNLGRLLYQPIPGTVFTYPFIISERHQYIQIKLNAAILSSSSVFLQYQLLDSSTGQTLFSERQVNNPNSKETYGIVCNGTTVQNVFNIKFSLSSKATELILQVRSLDANALFGVSNLEVYYGSCNDKCSQCQGPTASECLSCQGLYLQVNNGSCQTCPTGFYDAGSECRSCLPHCKTCQYNNPTKSIICLACQQYATLSSQGQCLTDFASFTMPQQLIYQNSNGWQSSQTNTQPLTRCGKYSLIGGLSVGREGSSLFKTFTQLQVHDQVEISFVFLTIDQRQDELNIYQILIDGELIETQQFTISTPNGNQTLSNQCGGQNPQMAMKISLSNIPHSSRNLTVTIRSFKNFFGIRDFTLTLNNQTNVPNCYQQINGTCVACYDGFAIHGSTCRECPQGYYLEQKQCQICPIECTACQKNINNQIICTGCIQPMQLSDGTCKDSTQAIYTRQIIPNSLQSQTNNWIFYPKLPQKGLDHCGKQTIIGSQQIKYKFLEMKRHLTQLPTHRGVRIYLQFYQIDQYEDNSVYFIFNGVRTNYTPAVNLKSICGDQNVADAVAKLEFHDSQHTGTELDFEVHVVGKVKVGINNFVVFLENCVGCEKQVGFQLDSIPIYSLNTPPQKGLEIKLIFDEPVQNGSSYQEIFNFAVKQQTSRRRLQGLIDYNSDLPIIWQELVVKKQYRALLDLDKDFNNKQIVANPINFWDLISQDNNKLLQSQSVSQQMPRYIDIDENDVDDRTNMRNLRNLFEGCAIVALWLGIASFLFGLSSAFDDFFILIQLIFVHVFIQLAYNPPSLRLTLEGMQIVQFMAWLPSGAREGIQNGIIPDNFYQQSPIEYQQYYQDTAFARTIYQTILFLVLILVIYLILLIFSHIVSNSQRQQRKYARNYFVKYYHDYQNNKFTFIDKVMRFCYFTVVWACVLQFIIFENQPNGFHIWNSILCIVMFVVWVGYPLIGYFYLRRQSNSLSEVSFDRKYEEVRVRSGRVWYFLVRYYKLLIIALLIGLLYNVNPLITLVPLILLNIADGIIVLLLKPFPITHQQQLNVFFYNKHNTAYYIAMAVQWFLFAVLEFFILILYSVRDSASSDSYMGLGYTCCAFIVLLLLVGIIRMAWGFFKIIEGCYSKSKEMKLSVANKVRKDTEPNDEIMPIKSSKDMQTVINPLQSGSRLNTIRKQSYVSKIN